MRYFILLLLLAVSAQASAKAPLIVAIIDTGYSRTGSQVPLCKVGRLDFTVSGNQEDSSPMRHGSNVTEIIARYGGNQGYCIVMLKVFRLRKGQIVFDIAAYIASLNYVEKLKPALLNLSLSGNYIAAEEIRLKRILDNGTTVVASAGNGGLDLNKVGCIIYPACVDPRIYVIGNSEGTSNIGRVVDAFEDGSNVRGGGVTLSGTSQAAAIFSGKVIRRAVGGVK